MSSITPTSLRSNLKAFKSKKTTPESLENINSIFSNNTFESIRDTINQVRSFSGDVPPATFATLLAKNTDVYNSLKASETRELLDIINGSASKIQDANNGGFRDKISLPFIYREHVKRVETEAGRSYNIPTVGLKSWPSVTGLYSAIHPFDPTLWINKIKRENPDWDMGQITEYMEDVKVKAATRGSMMHEAIETYLKDRVNFNMTRDCELVGRPYLKCIMDYLRYEIDTVIAIEPLAIIDMEEKLGPNCGCMGYIDLIGVHEGKNVIYDWKTSDKPKNVKYLDNYFIQVSAYAAMTYYTYGIKIDEARIIVAIAGKAKPQVFTLEREDIKGYLKMFFDNMKKYSLLV